MKTLSITLLIALALTVPSCGGGASNQNASENPNGVNPAESEGLPADFFGELSIDVSKAIVGTWGVKGYYFGKFTDESQDGSFGESTITFAPDGTLSTFSAPPLFDFPEFTVTAPEQCLAYIVPDGVLGTISHSALIDASMTYETVETDFNPFIRFIITGRNFTDCCAFEVGECSSFVPKIIDDVKLSVGYLVIGAKEGKIALMNQGSDFIAILTKVE